MRKWIHPYRQQALDQLSFLEVSKGTFIKGSGDQALLPVYSPRLIQYMKKGDENVVPANLFYEGMVIVLAADPNFESAGLYIRILGQEENLLQQLKESAAVIQETDAVVGASFAILILDLDPKDVSSLIYLLLRYHAEQMMGEVNAVLDELLTIDWEKIETDDLDLMAAFLIQQNRKEEAESLFSYIDGQRKEEMSEEGRLIYQELLTEKSNRAMQQALNQQNFDGAVKLFTEIPQQNRTPLHYFYYGEAQQGLGHFPQSIVSLTKAMEGGIHKSDLYNDLAIAYYLSQQVEQAAEVVEEGLGHFPTDENLLYNGVVYSLQLEKEEKAKHYLKQLQKIEIKDVEIAASVEELSRYMKD